MQTIKLCRGMGEMGVSHCVMAATSIVAGESCSDKPASVCPKIAAALRVINDRCPNDAMREQLLGHLPWLIIGTRGTLGDQIERAFRFAAAVAGTGAGAAAGAAAVAGARAAAAACAVDADPADPAAVDAARAAAYAAVDAADAAARAAAYAAVDADAEWELCVKKFIDFIESDIIPVYHTMPVEPGFRIEELITR